MSDNIVSLANFMKSPPAEVVAPPARLSSADRMERKRAIQIKALVEKANSNGGYITGVLGERFIPNGCPIFGFNTSDDWRKISPLREGSEAWLDAHNRKPNFAVTAHWPLLGVTAFYNYTKRDGMYKCEAFIYQHNEVVPTFYFSAWFEMLNDGIKLLSEVSDKAMESILQELKQKYNMALIDYNETKHIHSRSYVKRNGRTVTRKG